MDGNAIGEDGWVTIQSIEHSYRLTVANAVGEYQVAPQYYVELAKRPCWFHRTMTRLFFGWKWRDKAVE